MKNKVYLYLSIVIIVIALFVHNSMTKSIIEENDIDTINMKSYKKININNADIDELVLIPGIGKSLARTIIEYRNKNGQFKNIKELMNIKGIKEKKLKSIEEYICIE